MDGSKENSETNKSGIGLGVSVGVGVVGVGVGVGVGGVGRVAWPVRGSALQLDRTWRKKARRYEVFFGCTLRRRVPVDIREALNRKAK